MKILMGYFEDVKKTTTKKQQDQLIGYMNELFRGCVLILSDQLFAH